MGFTKLFSSILTSSVWCEDHPTVRVWIGMMALANIQGIVEGSIPGIASICRVTVPECQKAIELFSSPDPFSRNPDFEGRRIEPHLGGWRILNHENYRSKGQDKDGSRADYMRRDRSQHKDVTRNNELLHVTQKTEDRKQKTEKKKDLCPNSSDFDVFWNSYPKKVGKKKALQSWTKAKDRPSIEIVLKSLEAQKKSDQWSKDGGQYIPHPATWLNQGRWDDEIKTPEEEWIEKSRSAL